MAANLPKSSHLLAIEVCGPLDLETALLRFIGEITPAQLPAARMAIEGDAGFEFAPLIRDAATTAQLR